MAYIVKLDGSVEKFAVEATVYPEAKAAGLTPEEFLNAKYAADHNPALGTPYKQILASEGLVKAADNKFGIRSKTLHQVLNNIDTSNSAAANVDRKTDPFGSQSRTLFPIAVISAIEDAVQPDRVTDDVVFRRMAATTVPIAGDVYAQPILNYQTASGPDGVNAAKASRVTQLTQVPTMMLLTTSDKYASIPTYGIGIEFSSKALQSTTLDLFTMTLNRYLQIEKDTRVYTYISQLFAGDVDAGTSAVASVTSNSLDSAATGGVMTHKAWVKFLARNRKKRHIDYLICDLDTYLKIESRTGRPGTTSYDPTIARIDPQLVPASPVPFGSDVQWMIVEPATAGGPVPANTVWALDSTQAFMIISNTEGAYQATEQFVLRKSEVMVWHWSEDCRPLYPTDQTAFDVLVIS